MQNETSSSELKYLQKNKPTYKVKQKN